LFISLATNQSTNSPQPAFISISRADKGYDLEVRNGRLADILKILARETGVDLQVDPEVEKDDAPLELKLKNASIEEILERLTRSKAFVYEREGDTYRLASATVTSQGTPVAPAASPTAAWAAKAEDEVRSREEDAYIAQKGILVNSERPLRSYYRGDGGRAILLQNAVIDTSELPASFRALEVPPRFADPDTDYIIVQFDHRVGQQDRQALEAAGMSISHYVPNSAFAVHVPSSEREAALSKVPGVIHAEPYHPYYKMSSDVLTYMLGTADEKTQERVEQGEYNVLMFHGADGASEVQGAGAEILRTRKVNGRQMLVVKSDPASLEEIVKADAVQWVEVKPVAATMNDTGGRKIGATKLKALHPTLDGSGVIVGVNDSGIDYTHRGFAIDPNLPTSTNANTRIAAYIHSPSVTSDGIAGDNDGHGTHVSGSILGNGALSQTANSVPGSDGPPYVSGQFRGGAPNARVVMIEDFNSFTAEELAQQSYEKGARISNNSWGYLLDFTYNADSEAWDANVRDADAVTAGNQEFVVFFSAGNSGDGEKDGTGGEPGTVSSPANAKNVIAVGAVEQRRHAENFLENIFLGGTEFRSDLRTDTDWQVASFSARGPVIADGFARLKPDLVAPGEYVISAQSRDVFWDEYLNDFTPYDYRFNNVDTGTNYAFLSGTSMASPLAAGAGALFYQYYTNTFAKAPSAALVKAALINGARFLNSILYKYPIGGIVEGTVDQGWGMLDVLRAVDGPRISAADEVILLDQGDTTPLEVNEVFTYQVSLAPGEGGLKVTLVWTDPAGTTGNGKFLQNDLNLSALAPGGGAYIGNLFDDDGVNSLLVPSGTTFNDAINNVEQLMISDSTPGTYSIRVRCVENGGPQPQDFALVIMKGIGLEGRSEGIHPAVAVNTNNEPIIAYSFDPVKPDPTFSNLTHQILVKRWKGAVGDIDDLGRWLRLDDQWFEYRDSANPGFGISRTLENSQEPSIAVHNDDIYVAWQEQARPSDPGDVSKIFLRVWDGADWNELGGSGHGAGLSNFTNRNATIPKVVVTPNGIPVVAWKQSITGGASQVRVAYWNGAAWAGAAGSHTNGIPGSSLVGDFDMVVDPFFQILVAWEELSVQRVRVKRWNGATWENLGDVGNAPVANEPDLGLDGSTPYLAWKQTPSGVGTQLYTQVFASRYVAGSWQGFGGSATYPGVSGVNQSRQTPDTPQIEVAFNSDVFVAWHGGSTNYPNGVIVREFDGTSWSGVSGAGSLPGVIDLNQEIRRPNLILDHDGIPTLVFENNEAGENEIVVVQLVADREPPVFEGLKTAQGGTNQNVFLTWDPAVDAISSSIIYTIYRSPSSVACGNDPNCDASTVFSNPVAQVTNLTSFTVTGLTANQIYCFGVRARDTNDFEDANTVVLAAGPVSGAGDNDNDCLNNGLEFLAQSEPCVQDTDEDGMWDGWEWTYSTNNAVQLALTNLFMSAIDNGVDRIRTTAANDGDPRQLPFADLDSDGAPNIQEFQWWQTFRFTTNGCDPSPTTRTSPNPTVPDTDGDGMLDGFEIINGLNPTLNDGAADPDGDGLSNLDESRLGTDPRNADTDGDGLNDGAEAAAGTNPASSDTDQDGLSDGLETSIGSDPRDADSNNNGVSDGDIFQLGFDSPLAATNFYCLLDETFETTSPTVGDWTSYPLNTFLPFDFWHITVTEPDPATNVVASSLGTNKITLIHEHSTNRAYRAARDLSGPPGTNLNATYSIGSALSMALQSPLVNAETSKTLFVTWNEYYVTEFDKDLVSVQARGGGNTNWFVVRVPESGKSGVGNPTTNAPARWAHRTASLEAFAGLSNVQVRFVFSVLNSINNEFPGWWVDDVKICEGAVITGWVRSVNGRALGDVTVQAIGRGGVTNFVQGHRIAQPGKIFAEAKTAVDGSYRITGLPLGRYYVKASSAQHIDEFWDGPLTLGGVYAFGNEDNPGADARDVVSTAGWLDLRAPAASGVVEFELGPGNGKSCLGVSLSNLGGLQYPVLVDRLPARVWNGSTNAPAFTNYLSSTVAGLTDSKPDWVSNAVAPTLLCDYAPGIHRPYVGTNLLLYPLPEILLREGETTLVDVRTNQSQGQLTVLTEDLVAYSIRLDGRLTGQTTPAVFQLKEGKHQVELVDTGTTVIAPITFDAIIGLNTTIQFSANATRGDVGELYVTTIDLNGAAVTDATVYVNGVGTGLTPVVIHDLRPGKHSVVVVKDGFKRSERREVQAFSSQTNTTQFVLFQSDEDYDLVGDFTEVIGYTNRFLYSRDDDPDGDSLNNLFEFRQFLEAAVLMNPFQADTDADGMGDGDELAYDGISNSLAKSSIYTNSLEDAPSVQGLFVGQFLKGEDYFGIADIPAAIECDRFIAATSLYHTPLPPSKRPVLKVFTNIPAFLLHEGLTVGHNVAAELLADAMPDRVDTDGDGMWDGFEFLYGLATPAKLDVIECGRTTEDADFDGLSNLDEFLGPDGVANTNDWSNPNTADTDGDLIPDGWEYFYGFDPNSAADAFLDPDGDGLVNLSEYFGGTNPKLADTDADFLQDGEEVLIYQTDPIRIDTDLDGLSDGQEVRDRNLDGVADGGFFPNWAGGDLDNDGIMDGPTDWDTDGDGMPDGFEVIDRFGNTRQPALDPYDPTDGDEDPDGDGLTSLQEYLVRDALFGNPPTDFGGTPAIWDYSTDPFDSDSDDDGMPDGFEVIHGLHPMDPILIDPIPSGDPSDERYVTLGVGGDPDGDGLWNLREYNIRFRFNPNADPDSSIDRSTHPWRPDTDLDGLGDGEEDRTFAADPITQDTDNDRLPDGVAVTSKWAEIESTPRQTIYDYVPCVGCVWTDAFALAQGTVDPFFGLITGRLAVLPGIINDTTILNLSLTDLDFTGFETRIGLAAFNRGIATNRIDRSLGTNQWFWIPTPDYSDLMLFNERDMAEFLNKDISPDTTNYLVTDALGNFAAVTNEDVLDGYLVEFQEVPVVTNHYDQALNDLWMLRWPNDDDLPHWEIVQPNSTSPVPAARWGSGLGYVPVIETKNPRDDDSDPSRFNGAELLMDNRKLVLLGGRDGVRRFDDTWEFWIGSNQWVRSAAPMGKSGGLLQGLSEFNVINYFQYKNTKASSCSCEGVPYDCNGTAFGLPKDRPWSDSRSYDWTMVFGGWDNAHAYYGNFGNVLYYRSTDDRRPITETLYADLGVTEYIITQTTPSLTASAQDNGQRILIGRAMLDLAGDDALDTVTGYSALNFNNFFINAGCDEVVRATLQLVVLNVTGGDIPVTGVAEFQQGLRHSPETYASEFDTLEPSSRFGNAGWYNSSPFQFTISAGFSGVTNIDITEPIREFVSQSNWDSSRLGFVFDATGAGSPNYAAINIRTCGVEVVHIPSYKIQPEWKGPTGLLNVNGVIPQRKSAGLALDIERQQMLLFGGIDGNTVLADTRLGIQDFGGGDPKFLSWYNITDPEGPEARWGHSMVYDRKNDRFVMFGGFDADHRPLNDLWFAVPDQVSIVRTNELGEILNTNNVTAYSWVEVTSFKDPQRPQPRAGASMVYYGDYDYSRGIGDYCIGGNKQRVILFGGTDGNTYFNDTWVFDDRDTRWILVNPVGEHSQSPTPRAFAPIVWAQNAGENPDPIGFSDFTRHTENNPSPCPIPAAILFGGRTGVIPTGDDTDFDMVDDGTEVEIGGSTAGRDPRVNKIAITNHPTETYPFTFKRIGTAPWGFPLLSRGAIANFESLLNPDGVYASQRLLPFERERDPNHNLEVIPGENTVVGIQAERPDIVDLWFHRHGFGNPFDPRDAWERGIPDNSVAGPVAVPRYAYSGRWVYGTDVNGNYPNDARMELYSPLFDLLKPSLNSVPADANVSSYFLVFHEWLDLADSNDIVRVDAIRPSTQADILTRVTGVTRPIRPVVAERSNAYNTSGTWRRVVAPLDIVANETNLFLRFTLLSDASGSAGGWYIDDVAILQGGEISGNLTNLLGPVVGEQVNLYGVNINGNIQASSISGSGGLFGFGLLPYGSYLLNGSNVVLSSGSPTADVGPLDADSLVIVNFTMSSPFTVYWPAQPLYVYRVEYTDNLASGLWTLLTQVNADEFLESYVDDSAEPLRVYRVTRVVP